MGEYRGVVCAGTGLLLGGARVHESSVFASRQDALDWIHVVIQGNEEAGRDVGRSYVDHIPERLTRGYRRGDK